MAMPIGSTPLIDELGRSSLGWRMVFGTDGDGSTIGRVACLAVKSAPEDAFGRRPEPVYQGDEPKRMGANITSVVQQRNGRLLIGLNNGQVWEENEASNRARRIKLGSTAELSKITFGYVMRFEQGGSMRVRRLACDSSHAEQNVINKCKRAGYEGS